MQLGSQTLPRSASLAQKTAAYSWFNHSGLCWQEQWLHRPCTVALIPCLYAHLLISVFLLLAIAYLWTHPSGVPSWAQKKEEEDSGSIDIIDSSQQQRLEWLARSTAVYNDE